MGNRVITVGREFGSNGRAIAKKVSDLVGVAFYDREIIDMAAERSGILKEKLEKVEEKPVSRWLYQVANEPTKTGHSRLLPLNDILYDVESTIIREVAEKEDCIIVGRCADYILRDFTEIRSVFIYAPLEYRVKNIAGRFNISHQKALLKVKKTDKQRRLFYNYYTHKLFHWGTMGNYQLSFDSSVFGVDKTAELLAMVYKQI